MQTSGLVLDVYDDFRGDTIRSLFPHRSEIPGLVKEAAALKGEDRERLPDDAFALVLINGEERLRKYACIDAGNTALSVLFFQKHGHKLPEEAQKTAAANLAVACGWYDLPVTGLEKVALLGWAARQAIQHPWTTFQTAMVAPEMAHQIAENHKAVSELEAQQGNVGIGGQPITPEMMREHRMSKGASVGHLVPGHKGQTADKGPEEGDNTSKGLNAKQPEKLPQTSIKPEGKEVKTAHMNPYVDVSELEAQGEVTRKVASVYALEGRYPLDSYGQVKIASEYFTRYSREFQPEDRRTFCRALIKRAEALNIAVDDEVRHYGGEDFGSDDMLKIAHDSRINLLTDEGQRVLLTTLFEKAAELGPELFCATLEEFDKVAGLNYLYDKDIKDPYYSTFYKEAEQEFSFVHGNEMVTEDALRRLAKVGRPALKNTFGEDFVDEFCKEPVSIFKSMPIDQKKMIMRMANENSAPGIERLA